MTGATTSARDYIRYVAPLLCACGCFRKENGKVFFSWRVFLTLTPRSLLLTLTHNANNDDDDE